MVEGNFKNKQSELKRGQGKSQRHNRNHRFGFMDPVIILISAAFSQPLGQWILKYALDEVKHFNEVNRYKIFISVLMLALGLFIGVTWYIYSRRDR
jgi:hypothetical protein